MSSLEVKTIVADDEACSISSSMDLDLLCETSSSFKAWLAESSVPVKEIAFEGTLRVDGYIAGQLRSEGGKLVLTEGGTIDGDLFVREAIIDGTVRGDIHGSERVELGSSARVIGDIETAQLQIQPGATFQGSCIFNQKTDAREAA